MKLVELSAAQAAEAIRQRQISPVELVQALLQQIDSLEPELKAWVTVDREGALASARRCEREAGQEGNGPLHGVPLGVKDIIYTAGLRTTGGCPLFENFVPDHDATCVAGLRRAGAIILGKTVTTQFALSDPAATRNPWNHDHCPGGSSSGSAAGVAARMVPAAIGTQTGGSTLKPSAYCGVIGLKASYGRISRYGIFPASWSLDHVGAIARTVEDVAMLLQAMAGHDPLDPATSGQPVADYRQAARQRDRAPRLALVTDHFEASKPAIAAHLKEVVGRLERAGAQIREVRFPRPLTELLAIRSLIGQVEAAAVHAHALRDHPEGYFPKIRAMVEAGQLIPGSAYMQAQRLRRRLRPQMEKMLEGVDCLVMASIPDTAGDLTTTGDNSFQGTWSLFGFPAITLPSGLSKHRLPMGTQLVARPFREDTLLSAAAWSELVLGPMPSPL